MLSFRATTTAGGAPQSARALANQFNLQPPVSLRALIGAHLIQSKYTQVGGKQSPLGIAVNDSVTVQSAGQEFLRDFRGGQIKVASDGATSGFVTHQTVVRYRGIHCFGKTRGPGD